VRQTSGSTFRSPTNSCSRTQATPSNGRSTASVTRSRQASFQTGSFQRIRPAARRWPTDLLPLSSSPTQQRCFRGLPGILGSSTRQALGVLELVAADGTALSTTNRAYVVVPSKTAGQLKVIAYKWRRVRRRLRIFRDRRKYLWNNCHGLLGSGVPLLPVRMPERRRDCSELCDLPNPSRKLGAGVCCLRHSGEPDCRHSRIVLLLRERHGQSVRHEPMHLHRIDSDDEVGKRRLDGGSAHQ
jgi:hypothetical protein